MRLRIMIDLVCSYTITGESTDHSGSKSHIHDGMPHYVCIHGGPGRSLGFYLS